MMETSQLRILTAEVLLKLEGDERISEILGDAIIDTFEEYGIDPNEEGWEWLMEVAENIRFAANV